MCASSVSSSFSPSPFLSTCTRTPPFESLRLYATGEGPPTPPTFLLTYPSLILSHASFHSPCCPPQQGTQRQPHWEALVRLGLLHQWRICCWFRRLSFVSLCRTLAQLPHEGIILLCEAPTGERESKKNICARKNLFCVLLFAFANVGASGALLRS